MPIIRTEVVDESDGCGKKFSIVIVSEQFKGKSTLANHRAVQSALSSYIPSIHALTINTYDVEKWQKRSKA
ncbi:unnamed protein product [Enterobius vermicularis]|uniref:BolA-like protein n=1 Tax=Enterobius vermicularis TaxID=51028 RepID=A0A0N4VDD9_ENTVE|nr:unnamed protein product [Enterobius vermicularis]